MDDRVNHGTKFLSTFMYLYNPEHVPNKIEAKEQTLSFNICLWGNKKPLNDFTSEHRIILGVQSVEILKLIVRIQSWLLNMNHWS